MPLPDQNNQIQNYTYLVLIILGIYTLVPFFLLSFYNHPAADDYSFAVRDRQLDYLTVLQQYYLNWTGRYFSTITIFRINPIIDGWLVTYKIYSALLLFLFCGTLYFILRTFTKQAFTRTQTLAIGSMIFTLYLLQVPSISEGFYFFSTYATYQLPNIMALLLLVFLYHSFRSESRLARQMYIGLAAILCIAMIGSNEMALISTFTTISFITAFNFKNKEYRAHLLFLLILCVVCCSVAVLAPGNFVRKTDHPNSGRFVWSAVYAAFMTALSFYRWLLPILAASVIYILYFAFPLARTLKYKSLFDVKLSWVILYFLLTVFLMNFAFSWATGERATPRLENVIYFFFLIGWFYTLQVAIGKYEAAFTQERSVAKMIPAFTLLIFALSLFHIDNNISTAYTDLLTGKAHAYDRALKHRYKTLASSACATCNVSPLPAIPKSIYFSDIIARGEQPLNGVDMIWVNRGFAAYFRKKEVYLTAPNPPVQDNLTTLRNAGKSALTNKTISE